MNAASLAAAILGPDRPSERRPPSSLHRSFALDLPGELMPAVERYARRRQAPRRVVRREKASGVWESFAVDLAEGTGA